MNCPECGSNKMYKHGFVWSVRRRVQRWRCGNHKCGRTTIRVPKLGDEPPVDPLVDATRR